MDRQSSDIIHKLCERPELYEKAKLLLHAIKARTGPGSGFELGQRAIAIPAICSLLACEELGYSDVTDKVAQPASCLNRKDFAAALSIVRSALDAAKQREKDSRLTFAGLIRAGKHANADFMRSCMEDTENALILSADLRSHLKPPNDVVTVAIYCWTCKQLALRKFVAADIIKRHCIDEDDYKEVLDALNQNCDRVAIDIKKRVKALRAAKAAGSAVPPASVPTARSRSPIKPALRDLSSLQRQLSTTPTHKRKVAFSPVKDVEMDYDSGVEDTPSKRQKYSSPSKQFNSPAFTAFQNETTPRKYRFIIPEDDVTLVASSSRTTLDKLTEQSDGEESEFSEAEGTADESIGPVSDQEGTLDRDSDMDMAAPDASMSDASDALSAAESQASGSSTGAVTPRRKLRVLSHAAKPSDGSPRKSSRMTAQAPADDRLAHTQWRRHRPTLTDHKQWMQRDPRLEREWKMREAWVKEMIETIGVHPFENLRPIAGVQ